VLTGGAVDSQATLEAATARVLADEELIPLGWRTA
jgi:hypothetical protein